MAKRNNKQEEAEDAEAWKRFERAVDVVAKSPPQPKKNLKAAKKKKK